MKNQIAYACLALGVACASCSNNPKTVNTTTNADTAVLVNDTNNNLNANPINDTTVHEKVQSEQ